MLRAPKHSWAILQRLGLFESLVELFRSFEEPSVVQNMGEYGHEYVAIWQHAAQMEKRGTPSPYMLYRTGVPLIHAYSDVRSVYPTPGRKHKWPLESHPVLSHALSLRG